MSLNVSFSRPVGVVLVLLAIGCFGGVALGMVLANRAALIEERDAKTGFVARSLSANRSRAAPDESAPDVALAVEADSSTLAAARIDALVRATVTEAGGTVLSSRAEVKTSEVAAGRNERIEVQAVVQGRIEDLQSSLYRLENGRPLVLVEALDMRPVEQAEGPGGNAQAPRLTVTLTLSAFWSSGRS